MKSQHLKYHSDKIANIIAHFLRENGGLGNGFNTYCKGTVSKDIHWHLEWCTPGSENLTVKEVKRIGTVLYNEIRNYLVTNELTEAIIYNKDRDHGCVETYIKVNINHSSEVTFI